MFARQGVRVALALVAGILIPRGQVLTQLQVPTITISPGTGLKYPPGYQLAVHVDFCSPQGSFDAPGLVYFNGQQVAMGAQGSNPQCTDFQTADVTVTLVNGTNTVTASIYDSEFGQATAQYITPPDPPTIDATLHNGFHWSAGLCAVNCFNAVVSYTTPAYVSLDVPRAVTLFYSSGQVQSMHTIQASVWAYAIVPPTKLSLRLRRPDGTYVTLTAGSGTPDKTELFFQGRIGTSQLALQFEDTTLATGAYSYTLVARSWWDTTFTEATAPVRLLVLNERASPYGAGWSIAGLHRIKVGPGDSVVTWDGAGTLQFWKRTSSCSNGVCSFTPPAGEFDSLTYTFPGFRGAYPNNAYRRRFLDGSQMVFGDQGQLLFAEDAFANRTTYTWVDADRIQQITDPAGKTITFGYTSGKLAWIRDDPGNRTTNVTIDASNHVTQIQDPAGGKPFQQGQYTTRHRLRVWQDRRAVEWRHGYDFLGRVAVDSSPPVPIYGEAQPVRLLTRYSAPAIAVSVDPASGLGTSGSPAVNDDSLPPIGQVRPPTSVLFADVREEFRSNVFGALTEVVYPASSFARYGYNGDGLVTSALDSTGSRTYTWSGPRLMKVRDEVTHDSVMHEWNATYHQVTRTYGHVPETRSFIGTNGRVDSTRLANQPVARFTYDIRGRVLTATDPRGHSVQSYYASAEFQNTDSVRRGTRRMQFFYDGWGRAVKTVDPRGDADSVVYDVLNRVREDRGPLGHRVIYAYGDSLNLTSVTDARGQVYRSYRNAVGWDTLKLDPGNRADTLRYNRAGQVRTWRNRRNQLTTFDWNDVTGQLVQRTFADGRHDNFVYHATYMVSTNSEGADTLRFAPDTAWEVAVRGGVAHTVRTVRDTALKYSIVAAWRASQSPQEIRYDMDSAGRVWKMSTGSGYGVVDTLVYDVDGQLAQIKWHGTTALTRSNRPGHELARLKVSPIGLVNAFGAEFAHDSLTRVAEHVNGNRDQFEKYWYDALARITSYERRTASPPCPPTDTLSEFGARCTQPGSVLASESYLYDSVGNRVNSLSDTVDAGNRIRALKGYSLQYDADGNVTRKYLTADSLQFNQRLYWNSLNQLDSVRTWTGGGGGSWQVARFGYDGFGRRVRKSVGTDTTWYVYAGQHVLATYDKAGTLQRHYTYFPGTDRPHTLLAAGARSYFMTDGRGNVAGLMSADGLSVQAQYRYTPFGDSAYVSASLTNTIRFGGRELDPETRLYFNRARYYDPNLGRFVSEDPIGLAGGVNQFAYASNDPINSADPSGLRNCWAEWYNDWQWTPYYYWSEMAQEWLPFGGEWVNFSSYNVVCGDDNWADVAPLGYAGWADAGMGGGFVGDPPRSADQQKPTWAQCVENGYGLLAAKAALVGAAVYRAGEAFVEVGGAYLKDFRTTYPVNPLFSRGTGTAFNIGLRGRGIAILAAARPAVVVGRLALAFFGGYTISAAVACAADRNYYTTN